MHDYDPTRVRMTCGGLPIAPASDEPIAVGPPRRSGITVTFKAGSEGAAAMMELLRVDGSSRLPLPVVISDRRRPRQRRHARGGLRRMVHRRVMSAALHGIGMSGGIDQPLTITADLVKHKPQS